MKIKIGILGGIGPEATGLFYNMLIKRLQQKGMIRSNKDFPQIIINSIPAPELIYDSISSNELSPYLDGLEEIDKFGVDFIVMVCNTIHLYYNEFAQHISTPIINLKEELHKQLIRKNVSAALILGTPSTIKRGLYRFDNIKSLEPNEAELKQLTKAIFNYNKGYQKERQVSKVRRICKKYLNKGAEMVILGCTEFAVMLKNEKFPKIDTIKVLVDSVTEKTSSLQILKNP